ncbi:hypothetical protein [Streptomyces sp. NPDC048172]|uniref:hypothetical protein n=1 Tax=Streptomyces sp. NPDC048172 TaxID=3365505 RepID=UPI00372240E4
MSRFPAPTCCVGPVPPARFRPSGSDTVVIVVIAVLASALAVAGLAPSAILDVLGTAGLVALGTLLTLRGVRGGSRTVRLLIQGMRAATAA